MVGKYALVLLLVLIAHVSVASDSIEGVWITADGDGLIEFQVQDEQLSGVIIGSARDPNTGKTYQCTITLLDTNTLKLRGYIGFSLLGKTRVWTRK